MAEINGIKSVNQGWKIKPASDQQKQKNQQSNAQKEKREDKNQDQDGKPHIDDYA